MTIVERDVVRNAELVRIVFGHNPDDGVSRNWDCHPQYIRVTCVATKTRVLREFDGCVGLTIKKTVKPASRHLALTEVHCVCILARQERLVACNVSTIAVLHFIRTLPGDGHATRVYRPRGNPGYWRGSFPYYSR